MGAHQSAIPYDETTFAYEVGEPENGSDVHVTWATTPQPFKDIMKAHVRRYLPADLTTADRVSVPFYCSYIRKGSLTKKPLSVSLKHAIVEVLQEMDVSRKYTIHSDGSYWIVLFVQG